MSTNGDRWRRIVLAVDDSISIADVRQFLRTFGHSVSLTLVNVAPVPYALPVGIALPDEQRIQLSSAAKRAELRRRQLEAARNELGSKASILDRRGDLVSVLREVIRALQPDLLVIGSAASQVVDDLNLRHVGVTPLRDPCDLLVLANRARGTWDAEDERTHA